MKLNEREIEFFKNLHKTEISSSFIEYLERLSNYICDSRNWDNLQIKDKEIANSSAKVIKEMIIDRIKLQTKPKKEQEYEWD